MPFTDREAWNFIADLLDEGCPWQEVTLDKPPGCKAYEIIVGMPGSKTKLYIKIHLLGDCIYGRSFHLSDR